MAVTFKFKADGTGYTKGLENMRGQTRKWSSNIGKMVAGAFAFGAVVNGLKSWTQALGETAKAAKLLNTTAQEMEKLAFVAKKGKVEFDDLKEFISNVNERVFEGAIQAGHMAEEWKALGIAGADLKDKSPTEVMAMLSDGFKTTGDKANFAAAGIALFGDDFKRVINVLSMGGDEIKALGDKATTTSDATRQSVESLTQSWIDFKNNGANGLNIIIDPLKMIFKLIGWFVASTINLGITAISVVGSIGGAFKGLYKIMKSALSFDTKGIDQGVTQIKNAFTEIGDQVANLSETINSGLDDALNVEVKVKYTWDKEETDAQKALEKLAQKRLNIETEIAKIKKKSADEEEKARFNSLTTAQKLLEIAEKKKKLEFDIGVGEFSVDDEKRTPEQRSALADKLGKDKKALAELEGEEAKIKRDRTEESKKALAKSLKDAADKVAEFAKEVVQYNEDLAKLDAEKKTIIENQAFNKLDDEGKKASLLDKKARLEREAQEAGSKGDLKKQKEKEIEALNVGAEITGLEDGMAGDMNPSIIASSLASIGGGGGVAAFGNDPALATQNKQLSVLEQIEAHLNPAGGIGTEGARETPEL